MQRFVELHDVEVTVDGAVPSGPALWVANRVQPLDLPVLLSLGKAVPLVDAEVADWPLLGAQAAKLGCLFVDRGCLSSGASVLRQAGAAWSAGLPVLGFPELRRTDGRSPLQPFRRGLFGAAQLAQVPVVPFCLRYESEPARHPDLRRPWPHYWAWSRRARTRVTVRIGDPLSPTAGSTPESLASLTRLQVALLGAPRAVLGVC
jgi:1-acyl-sn-glycerol-3-phosphate acyltransferase